MVGMNETAAIVLGLLMAVLVALCLWAFALELWEATLELNQRRKRKSVIAVRLPNGEWETLPPKVSE
jgi:hypothetical protein